ncbi:MAG TPA: hypothetical protein VMO26_22250 [Vicinamibacterales bacterium]|nr:hypothetical protein [Vicinamibacterales bacterium]
MSLFPDVSAQNQAQPAPRARLIPARTVSLPGSSDSNSPAVWTLVDGVPRLFMFTSVAGTATRHSGVDISRLTALGQIDFDNHPGHGVWLEGVIPDVDGTWYGYYHQERPADVCAGDSRTIPRIGAARSRDLGATWEDLGVVLEASPNSHDCSSSNAYFVGGVGDFSVILDRDQQYLYFFFSQYVRREVSQGVSVARLAWADRDAPAGKVSVWLRNRLWLPARSVAAGDWVRHFYPTAGPIYRAEDDWHQGDVDAFWGPSVHWNTHLERFVMLLNRAKDTSWTQEGIYVAYAADLSEPASWSPPARLLSAGRWYPQVVGLESDGTDRQAGAIARFFMGGRSEYIIQFSK